MSDLAARTAPEIDRLVLGVNRQVGRSHGEWLMAIARDLGLDSLELVPHLGEFWLQMPVPVEFAEARLPYADPGSVAARIAEFESLGLLIGTPAGHTATERFRRLLRASIAAREETVAKMWAGLDGPVSEAFPVVSRVGRMASDDHIVARAHRELEPAKDPAHRLYGGLVTLRYIRQHDHVAAWKSSGLDASTVMVMTALWLGADVEAGAAGLRTLQRAGLASGLSLTADGRRVREAIEEETNRRVGATWAVLDHAQHRHLIDVLAALPPP